MTPSTDPEGIDMTEVPYLIELHGGGVNDGKRHEWRGQLPEIVRYPEPPSATAAGVRSMLTMAEPTSDPQVAGPKIACYRRSDHVTDEGYRIYDFERYE